MSWSPSSAAGSPRRSSDAFRETGGVSELHERIRDWWDADASHYDGAVGHAISDPVEAAAWTAALSRFLPDAPADVLDVGAGTGALSFLAAGLGHRVTGVDLSEGMLTKARAKADEQNLSVAFVLGPAEEPPSGPFDAVIERHVTWTLPDPEAALRAWRAVTRPGGALVIFGGSWAGEGPFVAAKDAVAKALQRARRVPDHHHGPYPPDVLHSLPLARTSSPAPYLAAIAGAGWQGARVHRLRDVEWAIGLRAPWPLGWLEYRPRYALVATA